MAARRKKRARYWNDHLKGSALFRGTIAQIAKRAGVSESTVSRLRAERVAEELKNRPAIAPVEQWQNVSRVPLFDSVIDLREPTALELLDRVTARLRACYADLRQLEKLGYK